MKNNRIFQIILVAVTLLLASGGFDVVNRQPALAEGGATAVTGEKILVSLSNDTVTWGDDTLYAINPSDGSGQTKIFDFHNNPNNSPLSTGQVFAPRVSANGKQIYFHSEFAYIYTPSRRNVFWIGSDGNTMDQVTPGEKSGMWGQSGNSTVSGQVRKGNGDGWGGAPVYLEGMNMVYADASGYFSFNNVPPGVRWLVAYKPGDLPFDSTPVNVVSNLNNTGLSLTPGSSWRASFQYPVLYGNRIYYNTGVVKWTDTDFAGEHAVYTSPADACTGIPDADAFDVGKVSGKIVVYDYQEGCGVGNNNHNGIYTVDKDGNNKQPLLDILNANNWNDVLQPEIFWSPDESKIAFKANYNYNNDPFNAQDVLVVINAADGSILGSAFSGASNVQLTLHGWNPAGDWLLFSRYTDVAQKNLSKLQVAANGSIDVNTLADLMTGQPISGATWGTLVDPNSPPPSPSLSVNYSAGQPGSKFIVSGQGFPAVRSASAAYGVQVNGVSVGTVSSTSGSFQFTLVTDSNAQEGAYLVSVSGVGAAAGTTYALNNAQPQRNDTSGDELNVPQSVTPAKQIYMPLVLK